MTGLTRIDWAIRFEVIAAMKESGGNKQKASELLGCNISSLYRYLRLYKIEPSEYVVLPNVYIPVMCYLSAPRKGNK